MQETVQTRVRDEDRMSQGIGRLELRLIVVRNGKRLAHYGTQGVLLSTILASSVHCVLVEKGCSDSGVRNVRAMEANKATRL